MAAGAPVLVPAGDLQISPWRLVAWLSERGGPVHGLVAGWLCLAPAILAIAWWLARRSPWPWALAVTVQLLALTVVASRFPHLMAAPLWPTLAAIVLVALASVVSSFPAAGAAPPN